MAEISEFPRTQESQVYADVTMEALQHVARQMPGGADMGALLGALAYIQAHFISGIKDHRVRKATLRSVDKMLHEQIAEFLKDGSGPNVELVKRGAN